MGPGEPEDLPIKITSAYGQFAMIPERLIGAGISDAAFRLYAVLALHADRNTNRTFVGHRSIAKLLGKSKRSVIRASAELEDAGVVEVPDVQAGGK